MNAFRFFLFIGVLFFVSLSVVGQGKYPRGCEPKDFRFVNTEVVLNETGQQRLYMFYNQSDEEVEVQRPLINLGMMVPRFTVILAPQTWSAFASDIQALGFECHVTAQDRSARKVSCADYLSICEYPRAQFALSNMGNYWVAANKDRQAIVKDTAAKGIYLRW